MLMPHARKCNQFWQAPSFLFKDQRVYAPACVTLGRTIQLSTMRLPQAEIEQAKVDESRIAILSQRLKEFEMDAADVLFSHDDFFNCRRLWPVSSPKDLNRYNKKSGCYFIFSTISKEKTPTFSDYQLFDKSAIECNDITYHCLYNGVRGADKSGSISTRLKQHLFSTQTPSQLRVKPTRKHKGADVPRTLAATGAMSLEWLSLADIAKLREELQGCHPASNEGNLISCSRIKEGLPADVDAENARLLNGINILDDKWSSYNFAIIVIEAKEPNLRHLIEVGFRLRYGTPPCVNDKNLPSSVD